jgi:polyhydroxybutyrate depolymerase
VLLHTVIGGRHTWPGGAAVEDLGFTTQQIDATLLMWDFFEAHANAP